MIKSIKSTTDLIKKKSLEVKKLILEISHKARVGHIGSALSIADILTVLYFEILKIDPKKPKSPLRDYFILSKGHAVAALYSVLYLKGFFSKKTLFSYCQNEGLLGEHPQHSIPGIEISTGSLGHGLSVGAGFSLASKINKTKNKTFVLISDAECNEGTIWEAALFANHNKLNNLIVIIDYNKVQALGTTKEVMNLEPLADKWLAFGWETVEIDGHNLDKLSSEIKKIISNQTKPTVIIAHTIRGKGVSFMEHKIQWHYISTSDTEYKNALEEIQNN